jgi:hypothetical protein
MCKMVYRAVSPVLLRIQHAQTSEQQYHLKPGHTFRGEWMIPQDINVNIILTNTVLCSTLITHSIEEEIYLLGLIEEISLQLCTPKVVGV